MMGHHSIILKVIPEPPLNSRDVKTILPPEITFFADDGNTDFLCGKCEALLADGIDEESLGRMVLKCNNCQSFNEFPFIKRHKDSD